MTPASRIARAITVGLIYSAAAIPLLAQFETRASISTSPYLPTSLVVGDFNRDGKLDLAVVNYLPTGKVMIFLGNGDGTFTAGASYSVALQPLYVATARFRHNGMLDLIVGDTGSSNVYVMLGNGDGTFQTAVPYPTTGRPLAVGSGSFTQDGKIDIIALAELGCNCVEVLPGNGDGTFGSAIVTPVPYNVTGFQLATGDFDGDGKLDVAVPGQFGAANQVDILLGSGDGSFRPNGFYPVSVDPLSVAAGRFNADNRIDLAVGNLLSNNVSILLGNGDGGFRQAIDYDTSGFATWVAVGDLNGDGEEDLAVSNLGSPSNPLAGSITVLLGNGDGTFAPGLDYPAGEDLNYVAIGDFNGDRMPDLVAVDTQGNAIITLLNTGTVTFSPTTPITFPNQLVGTTSGIVSATLTNSGASPLTISSFNYTGKPFHVQTNCKGSIAPGNQCTISATFSPQAINVSTGTITIRDSASSKPQFVELTGTGTVVKLVPTQLNFPPQKVGTKSATETIQLTNTGSSALNFPPQAIGIGGTDYYNFQQSNNCHASLAAGASCTISVIFRPSMTGSRTAFISVNDDGGGSPQNIPLSGTGD
jgi:FG-GAP-like repeat/Abnormal spindle-like microcephaly-assoc'd, ASPM-SPD-2-Hydin/FG-GAP repeat